MTNQLKIVLAAGILAAFAVPALAAINVPMLTCGQFVAMNAVDQLTASNDLILWTQVSANAGEAGTLAGLLGKMPKEDLSAYITLHCTDHPANTNVIARLKEPV